MKKKKLKLLFVVSAAIMLVVIWILAGDPGIGQKLDRISSIQYWGNDGSMAFSNYRYSAILENDTVKITIVRKGYDSEFIFTEDPAFLERITEVANEYEIGKWDGFEKYDRSAMDGKSFSLSIYTESGQEIDARGYMKYPKNYDVAMDKIKALFDEVYFKSYPE